MANIRYNAKVNGIEVPNFNIVFENEKSCTSEAMEVAEIFNNVLNVDREVTEVEISAYLKDNLMPMYSAKYAINGKTVTLHSPIKIIDIEKFIDNVCEECYEKD